MKEGSDSGKTKRMSTHLLTSHAVAGALSGCLTRLITQPLDVIKIRFQVQIGSKTSQHSNINYRGITQAMIHIVKNEGGLALWKGHGAAQALSISFGMVQFSLFENLSKHLIRQISTTDYVKPLINFSAGLSAGCIATILSFPFDTVRTRLIVQPSPKVYKGISDALFKMYTQEGSLSLYRGLWPTLLQIGPYTGFQFSLYKLFIDLSENYFGDNSGMQSLICGGASGTIAKTLVYPLDFGKKRLQVQGFNNMPTYRGLLNCLMVTAKNEGVLVWFRGLNPSIAKALVSTALHFYFFESALKLLTKYE